jgi:hypothetical protein
MKDWTVFILNTKRRVSILIATAELDLLCVRYSVRASGGTIVHYQSSMSYSYVLTQLSVLNYADMRNNVFI